MSLPLKQAQAESEEALANLHDAVVSVARMRFKADAAKGAIPGVVAEAAYLLNVGRHDMLRVLLDLHDACVEGDPSYFAAEDDEPPVRILARDYERVVEGDPADLGSGIDPVIIRLARLDPDE